MEILQGGRSIETKWEVVASKANDQSSVDIMFKCLYDTPIATRLSLRKIPDVAKVRA